MFCCVFEINDYALYNLGLIHEIFETIVTQDKKFVKKFAVLFVYLPL